MTNRVSRERERPPCLIPSEYILSLASVDFEVMKVSFIAFKLCLKSILCQCCDIAAYWLLNIFECTKIKKSIAIKSFISKRHKLSLFLFRRFVLESIQNSLHRILRFLRYNTAIHRTFKFSKAIFLLPRFLLVNLLQNMPGQATTLFVDVYQAKVLIVSNLFFRISTVPKKP